jgi:hypothetical protein
LLIANWQKEGRDNLEGTGGNIEQESSVALSQDGEPVRPAKRQRTAQDPDLVSQEQPSPKKPRKAGTVQTARFQSASQETFQSQGGPSGTKDSYEEEGQLSSNELRDVFVEVHVRKNFDREAYVTVPSSCDPQPDQYPQPSEPSLHAPSQSQSQLQTSRPHPRRSAFIWDEDIVPDSQEAGSSSYKLSETPTSKSGFTTRPNTGNNTELDLDFINSQRGSSRDETTGSGDVEAHVQEHSSYRARTSYLQEESQNNPSRPGLSAEIPLTDPQVETSWEDPPGSPRPESSYSGGVANESAPSVNLSITHETSHSNFSSEIQASLVDHLAYPITRGQGTWSEEAAGILNQLQPLQPSQTATEKSPSPQFQSQLLSPSDNKVNIEDCHDSGQVLDDFVERSAIFQISTAL